MASFTGGELSKVERTVRVKSNRQSGATLTLVFVVVAIVMVAACVRSLDLHHKSKELAVTEAQLESTLEAEQIRAEELVEREKYMKTKKYIEDEAKNKLGLVNEDEIVIKPKED